MNRYSPYGIAAVVWASAAAVSWFVAVPDWISLTNLLWLNGFALGLGATLLAVQRAGRSPRSITGVLHDIENPGFSGR